MGNVDYHAVAALERVQRILQSLENDCWDYVPKFDMPSVSLLNMVETY